jgi:hypothetical protein
LRVLWDPMVKRPCNDHELDLTESWQARAELLEVEPLAKRLRNRCVTWGAVQQADTLMAIEGRVLDRE